MADYNEAMKFVESHEWILLDARQPDVAVVGVTDHAQSLLGDLVFVELPQIGSEVVAKDTLGVLESVKAASDFYAPLSGEVIEINQAVIDDPTLINSDPHIQGWLVKLKLSNTAELDKLLDVKAYLASI